SGDVSDQNDVCVQQASAELENVGPDDFWSLKRLLKKQPVRGGWVLPGERSSDLAGLLLGSSWETSQADDENG
ncbi:MAG TPA: hypothetical protein VN648_02935, partial [Candidatus Methylomirabilis sp.]|nr:hypothetical protein [Candidatus Methylomirabilis sp.]